MKETIKDCIENLKTTLRWKEEEMEKSRLAFIEIVRKRTAEQIAHGWLDSDILTIQREYEEVKTFRAQIAGRDCGNQLGTRYEEIL